MKKLFIFALIGATLFNSCLKIDDGDTDATASGKYIYILAAGQNNYALDATQIAFRLNLLMTEANKQGIAFDKLNQVTVSVNKKSMELLSYLFPTGTTISRTENIVRVNFTDNYYDSGSVRSGSVLVNTGGHLLDELSTGNSWVVYLPDEKGLTYYSDSGQLNIDQLYTIIAAGSAARSWDVVFDSYDSYFNSLYHSEWNGSFTVVQNGAETLAYDDTMKSEFTFSGSASGDTYNGVNMKYQITSPLTIKPSCGSTLVFGGAIQCMFGDLVMIDEKTYPAKNSTVKWEQSTTDKCSSTVFITYNGTMQEW